MAKEDLVDRVNKALRAQEQAQTNPAESVTMTVEEHNDDGTTTTVGPEQGMPVAPETASRIMSNLESRPEYERAPTEESATAQIQSEAEASHPPAAPPATNDLLNEAPDRSVSSVLSERRERLEAHKKAQEAAQRAERARIAARRKEELELAAAAAAADPKRAAELKQRQEVRKRQQEEKAARERILKKIEDDKKERAARDAERKAAAKAADGKENAEYSTFQSPAAKRGDICGLQIRLFDGSTIRNRFPSSSTLEKDVRPWIDVEQQIAGSPYTFKQILAPLPSKSISESEEVQTLQDLGLVPNATLVLVPIASYQTAYETGGGGVAGTVGGAVRGVASVGMGLVGSVVGVPLGFAARALGRVIGTDGVPYSSPAVPKDEPKGDESARKSEGHVMYNGGGVSSP